MKTVLIRQLIDLITERCLCGWPVPPEIEFRQGRLFIDWLCPVCGACWDHYERVDVMA